MLNISPNTINQQVEIKRFNSFSKTNLSGANRMFTRWLVGTMVLIFIFLLLPWTQNIQSKGKVTTLQPGQRPQTIQSTIAGRIENWYVREGQLVQKGDTIVHLSEIKAEYFDPDLVSRTEQQVDAKEGAIASYGQKVEALDDQIDAMTSEQDFKQQQLANKIRQTEYKLASDLADMEQAYFQDSVSVVQYNRTAQLFERGIKSRADVEEKRMKVQEARAKYISAQNKVEASRNELANARLELSTVLYEYNQKVAKAESDKFSTLSAKYDAEGSVSKLRIQASNYEQRSHFYFILAPQDGFITKAIKPGIGETVKEGEGIVTIMPADYELAVELFIKPMDLPLVSTGQEVRFIFDGWPAFIFSGWPGQSFGTYSGTVVAIDNMISANGLYRILAAPRKDSEAWPEALRVGSGAQGIALLNNVPLWYEIWRKLNGFPPDYYDEGVDAAPKMKAPVKSIK
ncbi:MAG: HlyD family efflux transporter periplasmic adaptor subunit [Lewinellaceae bacterium]|nr:HlyD family efflux transporter periplasmic adaptor subunit [Phaeodactylibacter sp.]MCB0613941.1 HlyD family efflux transporter periplasmic adaptor subunit [Phaeodactylibacter sp.]MCB9348356.1 HlyD family efflux transporter periplasmic adaptor subunit [Lewinellaceae bacterium]